jgi:Flp pilus assembly protein TadG
MRRHAARRPGCRDSGSAEVLGLVLPAPAAIGLAVLVVFIGRQVDSRAQVQSAAESAAQAAALQITATAAHGAAADVATAMLLDPDTCTAPRTDLDLGRFVPGGEVAVTVTCTVSTRGVELLASTARSVSATAWAQVDPYRSMELPAP